MDEVIFRSGRKLENLQVQAEIVATKAKDVFIIYFHTGKSFFLRLWDEVPEMKETFKEGMAKLKIHSENIRMIYFDNIKGIYNAILDVFSKKWTKRDIYFGCVGLTIGFIIGIAVGISWKKREHVVRYMQAIQCPNYLGIESASVVEDALAPYNCGEYDILVNVKSASVQIIDVEICFGYGRTLRKILSNIHKEIKQPVILGRDCAGIVVDVGKKVTRFEVGDEVWVTVPFWAQGTLCQSIIVDESRAGKKPKNIGFEGASSLPYAGSWALTALNYAKLDRATAPDKQILILGGCSPVGCVLIQLLSQWNAIVSTTCYKRAIPVAKALGASYIIALEDSSHVNNSIINDGSKNSIEQNLQKQLELRGEIYDTIIITNKDCVQTKDLTKFVQPKGVVISTLPPALTSDSLGFISALLLRFYISSGFWLKKMFGLPQHNFDETHMCYATLDQLTEFVESGRLQTVVDKIYQPHDIEMALHHIQSPHAIGSTIITFR